MAKRQGSKENQALVEQVMQIAAGWARPWRHSPRSWCMICARPGTPFLPSTTTSPAGRSAIPPPSWAWRASPTTTIRRSSPTTRTSSPTGAVRKAPRSASKDSEGRYVAALCLNVDVTLFKGLASILEKFSSVEGDTVRESLDPASADAIRARIDQFALDLATTPQALGAEHRRALMQQLRDEGYLDLRRAKRNRGRTPGRVQGHRVQGDQVAGRRLACALPCSSAKFALFESRDFHPGLSLLHFRERKPCNHFSALRRGVFRYVLAGVGRLRQRGAGRRVPQVGIGYAGWRSRSA